MRVANTASVMFLQCLSFLRSTGAGGGGSGYMHYLANVPGIGHFLAKMCPCPGGGGGGPGICTIWLMSQELGTF